MRLAFLFTSLLFIAPLAAQNGVISADELNVLYVGLENPISIAIPGVSADKTVVKTTVGTIVKRDSQYLVLIPQRTANQALITIGKLKRKDTVWVFTKRFRIRNIPEPKFHLGTLNTELPCAISSLRIQSKIHLVIENFSYESVRFTVESYNAHFFMQYSGHHWVRVTGNNLAPILGLVNQMRNGDFIIFDSIRYSGPYSSMLNPVLCRTENQDSPPTEFYLISDAGKKISLPWNYSNISALYGSYSMVSGDSAKIKISDEIVKDRRDRIIKQFRIIDKDTLEYFLRGSVATITKNQFMAIGELAPEKGPHWDTSKTTALDSYSNATNLDKFIFHMLSGYRPIGNWKFYYAGVIIAEGEIDYSCFKRQYVWIYHVLQPPPEEHYVVHSEMVPLKPCEPRWDCPVNHYWWYLRPGADFKVYNASAMKAK